MPYSRKAQFHQIRELAHGSIGAGYAAVGTAFDDRVRIMMVQNYTDTQMMFSIDGSVDHFTLNAGAQVIFDVTTNRVDEVPFFMEIGDRVYVKQVAAPSSGSVYVSVIHGDAS